MKFADFVCFKATIAELQAKSRDEAITELVASLDKAGKLSRGTRDDVARAVIKREKEASTGIGKGVAIPHVKHSGVKDIVAVIGQSSTGIDFCALDEQPVYSIILLISPANNPDRHLQAMETVFRHLQSEKFRKFLRQCREPAKVEDLLREADEGPSW